MRSAILPEGLETIGKCAFGSVGSAGHRTRLYVPSTAVIHENAFSGSTLGRVEVMCGVISRSAFSNTRMKSLVLSDNVSKIMDNAFSDSNALSLLERLPANLRYIGNNAFEHSDYTQCRRSNGLTIPDGVDFGYCVFKGCSGLRRVFAGQTTWVNMMQASGTFSDTGIEAVTIPEGTTIIGSGVCRGCKALKSVSIPPTVRRIEYTAFNESGLQSISLPDSVLYIGESAFGALEQCQSIDASAKVWNLLLKEKAIKGIGISHISLPEGVDVIAEEALANCGNLRSVALPESLVGIGPKAFRNCSMLHSISIPKGVKSIGEKAFHACYSLRSISLQEGLVAIGIECFKDCRSLVSIVIPESVDIIGFGAFNYCDSLRQIVLRKEPEHSAYPTDCHRSIVWYVPDEYVECARLLRSGDTCSVMPMSELTLLAPLPEEASAPEGMKRLRLRLSFSSGCALISHKVEPQHLPMLADRQDAPLVMSRYLLNDIDNCKISPFLMQAKGFLQVMDSCYRQLDFNDVKAYYKETPVPNPLLCDEPTLMQPHYQPVEMYCDIFVGENEDFDAKKLMIGTYKLGEEMCIDASRICYGGVWYSGKVRFDDTEAELSSISFPFDDFHTYEDQNVFLYSHDGEIEQITVERYQLASTIVTDYLIRNM